MNSIDGKKWKELLVSGVNAIVNQKERINALNVFPVPDGDTGSNMAATGQYAIEEMVSFVSDDISEVAMRFSKGMLLGARGNSGVILSQIFKGFSVGFEKKSKIETQDLISAFRVAKEYAYKAVMKPVEGTILTVIRMIADQLSKKETKYKSILEVFSDVVKFGRVACDKTPALLPILKEVGVTDSGGEGLLLIFDGMEKALRGEPIGVEEEVSGSQAAILIKDEVYDGEFGYCTEFIVSLKRPKTFEKKKFEKLIEKMGNSIVTVKDDELLKVHIHTLKPGEILNFAQRYGEFLKIKSDNMEVLAKEAQEAKKKALMNSKSSLLMNDQVDNNHLKIGIVACHVGGGMIQYAKELGANSIIEGGQSMNPSAKDFVNAIESLDVDKIVILPNNSNIILVARQVAQTSTKQVVVIPTRTQQEGLAALMFFDQESTIKQNKKNMEDAIKSTKTGQVTLSTKTTKIDGVKVHEGEYLAIAGKKILKSTKLSIKAGQLIANELIDKNTEIVTIYYGEDANEEQALALSKLITNQHDVDVEIKNGGQPLYCFLLAFE